MMHALTIVTLVFSITNVAPLRRLRDRRPICPEISTAALENILGGAFNSRYMSVDKPIEQADAGGGKRDAFFVGDDFYVDDGFVQQVDEQPAWNVSNHVMLNKKKYGLHRSKRGLDYLQEWQCKSKVEWMDLGPDYYPRYLRSVVCLSKNCWFSLYKCKPRSFTVKLLRRKKNYCATFANNSGAKVGMVGLPRELRELWVWEERAVNFCCDCVRT